jgi:hypothetical protein
MMHVEASGGPDFSGKIRNFISRDELASDEVSSRRSRTWSTTSRCARRYLRSGLSTWRTIATSMPRTPAAACCERHLQGRWEARKNSRGSAWLTWSGSPKTNVEADGGARQASCGRQRQAGLDVAGHLRIRSAAIVLFFRLMFSRDALGQGSKLSDAHPLDQRRLAVWALRLGSGSNKRAKSDVIYLPSCPLGQPDADLPVSIPPFGIARMVQFFGTLLGCPPNPRPITVVVGMMSLPAYTSSRMEHP